MSLNIENKYLDYITDNIMELSKIEKMKATKLRNRELKLLKKEAKYNDVLKPKLQSLKEEKAQYNRAQKEIIKQKYETQKKRQIS